MRESLVDPVSPKAKKLLEDVTGFTPLTVHRNKLLLIFLRPDKHPSGMNIFHSCLCGFAWDTTVSIIPYIAAWLTVSS